MKNIILCEGKTDAILLSYYLGKVVGWSFDKKLTKRIALPIRNYEKKQIVDKSKDFISDINLVNYLNTERLKVKGELAVTLGTMFPQRTFTPIDVMLKNINWEAYKTIQEGFRRLEEI